MKNKSLRASIESVMNQALPALETIGVAIYSEDDLEFVLRPLFIDTLTICQYFDTEYTDRIELRFPISIRDYVRVFERSKGLSVVLTRTRLNYDGTKSRELPVVTRYSAMIIDPKDLKRQVPDAEYRTSLDVSMALQLVEKKMYEIRFTRVASPFVNTTVEGVIRTFMQSGFGITKLDMTPIENKTQYENIIIPPAKGIDDLLPYLQRRFGMYMKGMAFYYRDETMYIYPAYDTNPEKRDKVVRFYLAETGDYAGASSFYREQESGIDIVLTASTKTTDNTVRSAENSGTSVMFMRSSQTMDGFVKREGGAIIIDPRSTLTIENTQARPLMGQQYKNNTYKQPTDNPFYYASKLVADQAIFVQTGWAMAVPFLIPVKTPIQYSYDNNGSLVTHTGIIDQIVYQYEQVVAGPEGRVYSCHAQLLLRLEPNPISS